ncbi:MAG: hypothetical protein H6773_00470 [Pseudomonadales bacterium]|nr:hypothetical protein [Pseudomonadales bacterium]
MIFLDKEQVKEIYAAFLTRREKMEIPLIDQDAIDIVKIYTNQASHQHPLSKHRNARMINRPDTDFVIDHTAFLRALEQCHIDLESLSPLEKIY